MLLRSICKAVVDFGAAAVEAVVGGAVAVGVFGGAIVVVDYLIHCRD